MPGAEVLVDARLDPAMDLRSGIERAKDYWPSGSAGPKLGAG